MTSKKNDYQSYLATEPIIINEIEFRRVVINPECQEKHPDITDETILELVKQLDNKNIIEELSNPNYQGNLGLPLNPTPLQVAKYEICQNILNYTLKSKFTIEELAEQIDLNVPKAKELLLCHIDKFALEQLVDFASKLFTSFHLGVIKAEPREKERVKN
ncbi:hypothetical protein C1645_735617 [Glomus cerebriforme]|uniref:Uncharacterized protein n=1 Tax=Glomus cerebriforme TaxID=658196 RepID=A0A397TAA1_9GLOM|nr:hypothetical protein C1645_735617 [Glomus cerebriforme]